MNQEQAIIDRVNRFLDNHTFEVYYPFLDGNHENRSKTNVKAQITGIKEYKYQGAPKPYVTFTAFILPTNEISDSFNSMYRGVFGREKEMKTYDYAPYQDLAFIMINKMDELMKYFSLPSSMLTKVVNEVEPTNLNESLLVEGQLDKTTRKLVQDVIGFFKHQREGEFGLPEDMSEGDMVYELPGFKDFSLFLDLLLNDDIDTVDVDGDLYYDDNLMYLTIISNPEAGDSILDELTKELNEVIRHELEHIKQYEQGYEFPKKEPKSPVKYYTQQHELEAQRAGFRKRAKSEKADFETLVRNWFKKNPHKHNLKPSQQEKVIQQILQK
jgi:hypothetical protein